MKQFTHSTAWGEFSLASTQHPYLLNLFQSLKLRDSSHSNVSSVLQQVAQSEFQVEGGMPTFVDQSRFAEETRYYEQIIAESNQIPTRESSWHDFFNGIIWHQFPQTKRLLNRIHMSEIKQYGLHPRTVIRNKITHFDECGLILVGIGDDARQVCNLLEQHAWHEALLSYRGVWHKTIYPVVFGHANLEMMLEPFPGLTAKWLYIDLSDYSGSDEIISDDKFYSKGFLKACDQALSKRLQFEEDLNFTKFSPLPIMGIPEWHPQQDANFYSQTEFFRPKRPKKESMI